MKVSFQQLQIFSSSAPKGQQKAVTLKEIISYLRGLSQGSAFFFQVFVLDSRPHPCFTINQCSSERSFSAMKRLKSCLCNTISQSRINRLMVLSICKEALDEICLIQIGVMAVNIVIEYLVTVHHYFNSYFIHNITYYTILINTYNYNDVSMVKGD